MIDRAKLEEQIRNLFRDEMDVPDYLIPKIISLLEQNRAEGYAAAIKDAAKVAEDEPCTHCDVCPKMIARMIRDLLSRGSR